MKAMIPKNSETALAPRRDLEAAFADFLRLDVAQGDASLETIRTYTGQLTAFLDWCEREGIHPALATADDLKLYRKSLIEGGYARATVAGRLNTVRRFYTMATAHGYRPDNPAQGLRAPRDKTDRAERVKWLPLASLQALLGAPDPATVKGRRDRAILALMGIHGLRRVEITRLTTDKIDLDAGTLRVCGKGDKWRTIDLVDITRNLLQAHYSTRFPSGSVVEGRRVFVSISRHGKQGESLSVLGVSKMVDGFLEALGMKCKGVSCHSLRHSFATHALAAGARLDAISRALGHADLKSTMVYSQIVDRQKQNPAAFLVGALSI